MCVVCDCCTCCLVMSLQPLLLLHVSFAVLVIIVELVFVVVCCTLVLCGIYVHVFLSVAVVFLAFPCLIILFHVFCALYVFVVWSCFGHIVSLSARCMYVVGVVMFIRSIFRLCCVCVVRGVVVPQFSEFL